MNELPAILAAFRDEFPDETACATYLERLRWPSGLVCTSCAVVAEPYRIASRPGVLRCRSCKTETRVAVGTAMERSRTPLSVWFAAAFLLVRVKDLWSGSAYRAQQLLGLSRYETAHEIIRKLKVNMVVTAKLKGWVEIGAFDVRVRGGEIATLWAGIDQHGASRIVKAKSDQEFVDCAVEATAEIEDWIEETSYNINDNVENTDKSHDWHHDHNCPNCKICELARSVRQWLARRKAIDHRYLGEYIQEYEFIAHASKDPFEAFDALIGPRVGSSAGPVSWLPLFAGRKKPSGARGTQPKSSAADGGAPGGITLVETTRR